MDDMDGLDPMSFVMGAVSPAADSSEAPPPQLMATFQPLGPRSRRPLQIAVTSLGTQGIAALAAWASKSAPVYQAINDKGVITTVRTPLA